MFHRKWKVYWTTDALTNFYLILTVRILDIAQKKSRNFSHALTTPTRDVKKYSQATCILICIKCDILDGR